MKETIKYCPYRETIYLIPFFGGISMLFLVFAGCCLQMGDYYGMSTLIILGIILLWIAKALYDLSNTIFLFETQGLRIFGGKTSDYKSVPWEEIKYACYIKSFKGFEYLVLSSSKLEYKQIKRFIEWNIGISKKNVEFFKAIPVNNCLDRLQVETLIGGKIE